MNGSERVSFANRRRAGHTRIVVIVVVTLLVVAISLALLYFPISPLRPRFVSYEYSVTVEVDSSDQFEVICPMPADFLGRACADLVTSPTILGNAVVAVVTTPYGEGLKIEGAGSVAVSWSHSYTYRLSDQGIYDHFSNLTMLSCLAMDTNYKAPMRPCHQIVQE